MLSQARYGMERMSHELIRLKTTDITTIAANRLDFTDSGGAATNYRLATVGGVTEVLRGSDILTPKATNLVFTYLDDSGNVTATIANIRRIKWDLTVPETNGGNITIRSSVYLRSTYYANFR
jgi:hypothetical protein